MPGSPQPHALGRDGKAPALGWPVTLNKHRGAWPCLFANFSELFGSAPSWVPSTLNGPVRPGWQVLPFKVRGEKAWHPRTRHGERSACWSSRRVQNAVFSSGAPRPQLDQLHTHNKETHPALKISLEATPGPLGRESRVVGGRLGIWCEDEGSLSFLLQPPGSLGPSSLASLF